MFIPIRNRLHVFLILISILSLCFGLTTATSQEEGNEPVNVESKESVKNARETASKRGRVRNSKVVFITDATFDQYINSKNSVKRSDWIIAFTATWCSHCSLFKPELDLAAETLDVQDISVGIIDLDESPALSARFMITRIPSLYHIDSNLRVRTYPSEKRSAPKTAAEIIKFATSTYTQVQPINRLISPFGIGGRLIGFLASISSKSTAAIGSAFSPAGLQIVLTMIACLISWFVFSRLGSNDPDKVGPKKK